ncbi:MAG: radical SAM family heme chaperone HemW [Clostridiales bacterium]|nr:radical SAM family heme chaperone HemW [Clostridiales bacterium]
MTSLYVHIPFCVRKCAYCDFESYAGRLDRADAYICRVLEEAKKRRAEYGAFSCLSVYLGGGTPSLLTPEQLGRLCGELFDMFPPEKDAEVTLEANPGTVTPELFAAAVRLGFNRLSLGVQAKQERLLKLLGRVHTFPEALRAVEMAREAGIRNINCDVMCCLPTQMEEELNETLCSVADAGAEHISCYSLILEEGTRLHRQVESGELSLPDEEAQRRQLKSASATLKSRGFERYEISNYARKGCESRHNMVYWERGDYLGLGCAAHSFMRGERFGNPGFDRYLAGEDGLDREAVSRASALEEEILLGTRLVKGINLERIRVEYGAQAADKLLGRAEKLKGLVLIEDGRLKLTDEGFFVHNAVVLELAAAVQGAVPDI